MPLYEYQCEECDHRFEVIQKSFSDPPVAKCPKCGGPVRKLQSSPAIQFKGSGWYITDYARKDQAVTKGEDGDGGKEAKEKGDKTDKADKADTADKADKSEKTDKSPATAASSSSTPSSPGSSSSSSSTKNS